MLTSLHNFSHVSSLLHIWITENNRDETTIYIQNSHFKNISLGVSLCVDHVSIETLDVDILTLSWHQCLNPKVSIKIDKFGETWKFCHFSTARLDLDREVGGFLHISCHDFPTQETLSFSYSKCLHNVKISWQILTISNCLDNLDKNLNKTKSQMKSLNFKNLDRDKKKFVLTVKKILTGFKSLSWFVLTFKTPRLKKSWPRYQNFWSRHDG